MEGISRAAGVGPTIKIGGVDYTVKGRILEHYAAIEAEILAKRESPFKLMEDVILKAPSPEVRRALVEQALNRSEQWRFVTQQDISAFLKTPTGMCFSVWLAIRHNDPQLLTLEYVTSKVMEDIQTKVTIAAQKARAEAAAKEEAEKAAIEKAAAEEAHDKATDELSAKIEQASGLDERGNSTGPAA